jgi:carboxypeptidase family protein
MNGSPKTQAMALAAALACSCGGGSTTPAGIGGPGDGHSIAGTVTGAVSDGVLVTLAGSASATMTTSGGGRYSFSGLADGAYMLTPTRPGYTFAPASIAVTVGGADVNSRDFAASIAPAAGAWAWRAPVAYGEDLLAIWGSGASDVWAVGRKGAIVHWDGNGWSTVASGTQRTLRGLWGTGGASRRPKAIGRATVRRDRVRLHRSSG